MKWQHPRDPEKFWDVFGLVWTGCLSRAEHTPTQEPSVSHQQLPKTLKQGRFLLLWDYMKTVCFRQHAGHITNRMTQNKAGCPNTKSTQSAIWCSYCTNCWQNVFSLHVKSKFQPNKTVLKLILVHPHVPKEQACLQSFTPLESIFREPLLG